MKDIIDKNYSQIDDAINAIIEGSVPEGMEQVAEEYVHGNAADRLKEYDSFDSEKAYQLFWESVRPARFISLRWAWAGIAVAAAVAALFVITKGNDNTSATKEIAKVENTTTVSSSQEVTKKKPVPVLSHNVPTITLANGKAISLSDALIEEDGLSIKTGRSSIEILTDGMKEVQDLVIRIPRGRQYEMTLSDGTHVWLNSDSRLIFPSRFEGSRKVEVRGQAYFDVSHTGEPFCVICSRGTVNVMGTSFDISDYYGEATKVTLVSGEVAFTERGNSHILQPGQQAIQEKVGVETQVINVDTRRYTAWKDGLIYFNDERLEAIMNEVERIYDVKVTFADASLKDATFTAECSRYKSVDDFLCLLSKTGTFSYAIKNREVKLYY